MIIFYHSLSSLASNPLLLFARKYDVAPRRVAMMRCLPLCARRHTSFASAFIIGRSPHHLPKANIIQKTHLCLGRQKCVFCWRRRRDSLGTQAFRCTVATKDFSFPRSSLGRKNPSCCHSKNLPSSRNASGRFFSLSCRYPALVKARLLAKKIKGN